MPGSKLIEGTVNYSMTRSQAVSFDRLNAFKRWFTHRSAFRDIRSILNLLSRESLDWLAKVILWKLLRNNIGLSYFVRINLHSLVFILRNEIRREYIKGLCLTEKLNTTFIFNILLIFLFFLSLIIDGVVERYSHARDRDCQEILAFLHQNSHWDVTSDVFSFGNQVARQQNGMPLAFRNPFLEKSLNLLVLCY